MKRCCLLASLMSIILPSLAGTIYVSGGGNALQKAIDTAKAGDILLVEPGTYSAIDTQGKEIEIRSTKGPKQTFLTTGSFSKNFGVKWGIGRNVKFAALLVSDANTEIWSEEYDDVYPTGVQWSEWDATQLPHSTLVGFTIQGSAITGDECFTVNGGRIVNCILTDANIHAAEAEGCLFVCPKRNDGELVCDSRLVNCTVVVGGSRRCDCDLYCSELINTIVYALNDEVDITWSSIVQPRMLNSVCYNIKRITSEGYPMDLSGILKVDPLFADRANGDYRLTAASPCVDKGTNELSEADADLNGGARIVNGTVDIGAYEYGSTPLYEELEGLESFYGPFVPGEKVALTILALVGYTAKGLPSGLKLNKKTGEITGAAKKPTGEAGVTVTFTKKDSPTLTAQFVVGPIPTINVTLEGDTEKCKVTGANKAYLVGKKVSLQAKGPKGTAFVGWFKDGAPWPSEEEFLEPKIKYVMTRENLNLVARFEKERMSIDASVLQFAAFKVGAEVAEGAVVVDVETQSGLKSLKASKLPSGLKLKQNKVTGVWSIYGKPKKAGGFTVTLKATAKSGAVETLVVPVTVGDKDSSDFGKLPDWAVGTFEVYEYETWSGGCVWDALRASVTIDAKGNMTGKNVEAAGAGKPLEIGSIKGKLRTISCGDDGDVVYTVIGDDFVVEVFRTNICGLVLGAVRGKNTGDAAGTLAYVEWPIVGFQNVWKKHAGTFLTPTFAEGASTDIALEGMVTGYEHEMDDAYLVSGCHVKLVYGENGVIVSMFYEPGATVASSSYEAQLTPYEYDRENKVLRAFTTVLFPMKDRHGVGIHLFLKINVSASVIYGNTDVELEDYLLESR